MSGAKQKAHKATTPAAVHKLKESVSAKPPTGSTKSTEDVAEDEDVPPVSESDAPAPTAAPSPSEKSGNDTRKCCSMCSTTAFDDLIHCDSCDSSICKKCDPKKRMCPCEDARDVCGRVQCGHCRAGEKAPGFDKKKKWLRCKYCHNTVCDHCSAMGKQMGLGGGMPLSSKQACCSDCAKMWMESVEGPPGGDY